MYNETGSKIKEWATCSVVVEITLFVFAGIVSMAILFLSQELSELGTFLCIGCIAVSVFGIVFVWGKHLLLAGFGELIEKTTEASHEVSEIKKIIIDSKSKVETDKAGENENLSEEILIKKQLLKDCLEQGLITDEEYEKKLHEL